MNVDHGVRRAKLARRRAHDSHAHAVVQAERAPEGEDDLPGIQIVGVSEWEGRKALTLNPEYREIGLAVVESGKTGEAVKLPLT